MFSEENTSYKTVRQTFIEKVVTFSYTVSLYFVLLRMKDIFFKPGIFINHILQIFALLILAQIMQSCIFNQSINCSPNLIKYKHAFSCEVYFYILLMLTLRFVMTVFVDHKLSHSNCLRPQTQTFYQDL